MTFAALATPLAWALLVAVAAAAAILFWIRPRPERLVVPSMIVWDRVIGDVRAQSIWERVRWLVSLLLTVLVALALALAWLRPSLRDTATDTRRLLVVLDSSWSMRATTSDGRTRWDHAIARARALVASSPHAEVAVATTAEGVQIGPTADRASVADVLTRLVPTGAVDGAWPRIAGLAEVHVFSDGQRISAFPPEASVHSVFEPASNVSVTALAASLAVDRAAGADVLVAVTNFSPVHRTLRLVVSRGTEAVMDERIAVGARGSWRRVLALPQAGDPRFHARVVDADDALADDDERSTWFDPSDPLIVGLVSEGTTLSSLLAADRGRRIVVATPHTYEATAADVWIFDRWVPPVAPGKPALVFEPPASTWLGPLTTEEINPSLRAPSGDAPDAYDILDGVDLSDVIVTRVSPVESSSLEPVVTSPQGHTLVGIEQQRDRRLVVVAFSTSTSNVASTTALPILVGNALDWLARSLRARRATPGRTLLAPGTSRVLDPSGRPVPLERVGDRVAVVFRQFGLHRVEAGRSSHVVDVTLGDSRPSNLEASRVPPMSSDAPVSPPMLWWRLAALVAFGLVLCEWVSWQRRITV